MARKSELGGEGGGGMKPIILSLVIGLLGGMIGGGLVFSVLPQATQVQIPEFIEQDTSALEAFDGLMNELANVTNRLQTLESEVSVPEGLKERLDAFDVLDADRASIIEEGRRNIAGFQDELDKISRDFIALSESISTVQLGNLTMLKGDLENQLDVLAAELLVAQFEISLLQALFENGPIEEDEPPLIDIDIPILPPAELLLVQNITFLDLAGQIFEPMRGVGLQIQSDVLNIDEGPVQFNILVRVIDLDRGAVVSQQSLIVNLELQPGETLKPAIRWVPPRNGNFLIQVITLDPTNEITLSVMTTLRVQV